jgi:hypothetical protein
MEGLYVAIVPCLAAMALAWITAAAIVALCRGDRLGTALKTWARGLVEIIAGLG